MMIGIKIGLINRTTNFGYEQANLVKLHCIKNERLTIMLKRSVEYYYTIRIFLYYLDWNIPFGERKLFKC